MSCRIITSPITGKEETSQTWNDIRAFVQTEEEADRLYGQLSSPAFKSWFGDWVNNPGGKDVSKVVNKIGEPLLVYHGTSEEFNIFEMRSSGLTFFAESQAYAELYSKKKTENIQLLKRILKQSTEVFDALDAEKGYPWLYASIETMAKEGYSVDKITNLVLNNLDFVKNFEPDYEREYIQDSGDEYADDPNYRDTNIDYEEIKNKNIEDVVTEVLGKIYNSDRTLDILNDLENNVSTNEADLVRFAAKQGLETIMSGFLNIRNPQLANDISSESIKEGTLKLSNISDGLIGTDATYIHRVNGKKEVKENEKVYAIKNPNQVKSIFNVGTFGIDKGGYDNTKYGFVGTENTVAAKVTKIKELEANGAIRLQPITNGVSFYYDPNNIYFQKKQGVPASKAADATLNVMKEAGKQMGINFQDLSDYAEKYDVDVDGVNGVADLTRGVIAIALGRENVALTEETVHIATAIVEQVNPALMTKMISEIGRFKIYDQVYKQYSQDPRYQTSDGKPNIRKLKKEAVDKLIAEHIVNQLEGNTEFPSLQEEANRNLAQRLWDAVLDFIKSLYNSKSKTDIFADTAAQIVAGEVGGTVSDIKEGGIYLQKTSEAVDKIYNKIVDMDNRLTLNPETATDNRHYKLDGTKRVTLSVTEKIKGKNKNERTDFQKSQDVQMQNWGLTGHGFIENTFINNLIDKDGYARKDFGKVKIDSPLNATIEKSIRSYTEDLVRSYPEGARFLVERKVVNEKVKGMLASTVDLIVIFEDPITGEVKADIYDWKFTNFDKSFNEDIPFYKQDEWKLQMGEYSKILYNYGLKPNQLRRARMIPFVATYRNAIPGDTKSKLILSGLEVGKFDNLKETKLYLLPVAIDTESTGDKKRDELIKSLRAQWKKLYKKPTSPEERFAKNIRLNELSKAIRYLHMKLDFSPLYNIGKSFLENAKKTMDDFENIDYSKLTQQEIASRLGDLLEFKNSAEKFTKIDQTYLASLNKEQLTSEEQETLKGLERISNATDRMILEINELQKDFVVQYALKEGATTQESKDRFLDAEREIGFLSKTFLEGSKLSSRVIQLAANTILNAQSLVDIQTAKMIRQYEPLLLALEKEAAAKGVSAFDLIGKVDGDTLSLIKKIDKDFWDELAKAKDRKDKRFLLENMDVQKYNELAKATIASGIEELEKVQFAADPAKDKEIREFRIKKLKDSLDINRETFSGYQNYDFARLFSEAMNEEDHLSKEYKEMAKSKAALDMWDFLTALNQRGKDMGYLSQKGLSFFPLVEATMLDKISQSKELGDTAKDMFKDLYTVREQENQNYSKLDPETNKVKKEIPKYFTRTERDVTQLSKDLTKVGPLWIRALLKYEMAKSMEDMLLTMHSVEKARGHIITEKDEIVWEGGAPKVDLASNKNADQLQIIADDFLYGLNEDLSSIGNIGLGKLTKDENKKLATKKLLNSANKLTQSLAVGLKALIAIPNYFGQHFQAFINAGNLYTPAEYEKNHLKMFVPGGLTTEDKALIDLFIPLNENIAGEKQKELAKKQGYVKALSAWSIQDITMATNYLPEKILQMTNAKTMNDNSMVENGNIVNIRQYLAAEDRKTKYKMSVADRKALEATFEDRVKELKETKSLSKIVKVTDNDITIPGVSDEELAKYRTKVIEYGRDLSGQMNMDNKAEYRRDSLLRSFMMFKGWIPKQVSVRTLDINKNLQNDEWQYGRTRLFVKTIAHLGRNTISGMRDILQGNEKGLAIMDEILEEKRKDYFNKTGQVLDISQEEFYDLMRRQLANQMKELGLLVGLLALVLAAKAAVPPDDADEYTKNKYKFWAKAMNKISDELAFYYNPLSFESMTKGSVLPAMGLLAKVERAFGALSKEAYGYATDDQELQDKAHPTKYFLDLIPGPAQFQQEILPLLYPELAKEMGIRVSSQARQQ